MSGAGPLAGQVALVTGASRGIGLAVAQVLRGAGAQVARLSRSLEAGTAEGWTNLRCDVTDPNDVERAVADLLEGPGVPQILVNSAGIFFVKPIAQTAPAEFATTLATNLVGPFLLVRGLLPHMKKRGAGHIVMIGSVSDHRAFPGNAAYGASKHGVRALHEVIGLELRGTAVRATLISPGPVDTDIWDSVDPDSRPGFTKRKDMLQIEDIAEAVLWAVTRPLRVNVEEIRVVPTGYRPRD